METFLLKTTVLLASVGAWTFTAPDQQEEYPLGIVFLEIKYDNLKNTCSGSVIGNYSIITAAHCVDNNPRQIIVDLNKGYGLNNHTNCQRDKLWTEGDQCVQRMIDLKNNKEASIQHQEYLRTAPKFASGKNGATAWLTSDMAILTVDIGFFKTQRDLQLHSFRLNQKTNLRTEKRRKKKRSKKKRKQGRRTRGKKYRGKNRGDRKSRWQLFTGSGFGKSFGHSQERPLTKGHKRLVRSGLAQQISHSELAKELTKELKYQMKTAYARNILLDDLLNIKNNGKNVEFPKDWIASRGVWRLSSQNPDIYEKKYSQVREHNILPFVRPTMCYGDSGGPMYRYQKRKTYICDEKRSRCEMKRIKQKVLFGINSIMDDYCQQFMISMNVMSRKNKNFIYNTLKKEDREYAFQIRRNG